MKKKLAVLGLAATMMMSLFAGCGGKGSSGGKDASADKGSVYYLNFKPEADAQWQELAKIYTEQTGVPVTFGVITTENIEQAIERAGSKAGNKGYDCAVSAIEMVNLIREMDAE